MLRSPRRTKPYRRLGDAARERIRAGGVLAPGRASLPLTDYRALVARLTQTARSRCEIGWCRVLKKLDPMHVPGKGAHGTPDDAHHILMGCRQCHDKIDVTHEIQVEPLGNETFRQTDVATGRMYLYHRAKGEAALG